MRYRGAWSSKRRSGEWKAKTAVLAEAYVREAHESEAHTISITRDGILIEIEELRELANAEIETKAKEEPRS
jgi:hypothetical protein